jgi:hypothetical protein
MMLTEMDRTQCVECLNGDLRRGWQKGKYRVELEREKIRSMKASPLLRQANEHAAGNRST